MTWIQLSAGGEILREYDATNRLTAETHREEDSGIDNRTEFSCDVIFIIRVEQKGMKKCEEYLEAPGKREPGLPQFPVSEWFF